MARTLLDTPAWNQLDDGGDVYEATDCGFECMAMVNCIVKRSRPNIMEGTYRQILGQLQHVGIGRPGLTSAADLHQLAQYLGVAAQVRADATDAALRNWNAYLASRQCSIILGRWDSQELHWMLLLASPPGDTWIVNDPWGGVRRTITDAQVRAEYAGSYLRILSTPDSLP